MKSKSIYLSVSMRNISSVDGFRWNCNTTTKKIAFEQNTMSSNRTKQKREKNANRILQIRKFNDSIVSCIYKHSTVSGHVCVCLCVCLRSVGAVEKAKWTHAIFFRWKDGQRIYECLIYVFVFVLDDGDRRLESIFVIAV